MKRNSSEPKPYVIRASYEPLSYALSILFFYVVLLIAGLWMNGDFTFVERMLKGPFLYVDVVLIPGFLFAIYCAIRRRRSIVFSVGKAGIQIKQRLIGWNDIKNVFEENNKDDYYVFPHPILYVCKKNGEKIRFDYYHKYFLPPRCQLRDAIKYYSDEAVPFIEYRGNHSIFGK